ncbi:diphthamide biosynthesis protein [Sistotremastrum suecicum HHB10207 ss-3]|uniref:2-(3-amino-3-carboxypropyl)histidine synthase subunit 2 n=1 Tax=Sistotremastrum suecicum HHB10207 ss-3 TaxID=1314776 RepID=A0A166HB45_9AGAM|nr:diphthamide biosynthesis protein [Sistotremastrum suecicum HHB10207 ss-3]
MADAFSSSSQDPIARTIQVSDVSNHLTNIHADIDHTYDIQRTVHLINQGSFSQIALQFPDELLHDSVPVYQALKNTLGPEINIFVLADTSYGSCCVDEVAAEHVNADMVIHYGHTCLSMTTRLPVIYVLPKRALDPAQTLHEFLKLVDSIPQHLILIHDVAYTHQAANILSHLRGAAPHASVYYTPIPTDVVQPGARAAAEKEAGSHSLHRRYSLPENVNLSDCTILYIGEESLALNNILLTHSNCPVYVYDPAERTCRYESGRSNKLLMRRYAAMLKARDADTFGILVGTLGVASYLPLVSHLRSAIKSVNRKSYTLSVGKLNPAKLANFMEIECFVIVACPENSIVESKEFYKPIVTPFELMLALNSEHVWTGDYDLDFERVISQRVSDGICLALLQEQPNDEPSFSLVTGKYHSRRQTQNDQDEPTDANALPSTALQVRLASFLQSRSYQGLEARVGEDDPSILEQGRSGIARDYTTDHLDGQAQ